MLLALASASDLPGSGSRQYLSMMFRRKLQALDYHSSETIDASKPDDVRALVVWLEDQKIRHYKIEERDILRTSSGDVWKTSFRKYLTELECPFEFDSESHSAIDWLLGVAVRYEYSDAAEEYSHLKCGLVSESPVEKATVVKSVPDIDPGDKLFVSGVQALAKILLVSNHPDVSVLLEASRLVIEEKLSQEALERASEREKDKAKLKKEKQYNVSAKDCGFDLQDPVLGEAAKVLRLLHIQELRFLQTNINELIVAVQSITANPKTDQSLGQVGK